MRNQSGEVQRFKVSKTLNATEGGNVEIRCRKGRRQRAWSLEPGRVIKRLCRSSDRGDQGWHQGDSAQNREERAGGVDNI